MVSQVQPVEVGGIDLTRVKWDSYIKRWLLYAYRFIPSGRCVDGKSAEDLVFQSIDAVFSGRRHYHRPQLFANSNEPDHEGPFFVYVCGVIRAYFQAACKFDNRKTKLLFDPDSDSSATEPNEITDQLAISCHYLKQFEQMKEFEAFRNFLYQHSNDQLLHNVVDMLQNSESIADSAARKAEKLGVAIKDFNNALKRLKRILEKFLIDSTGECTSNSLPRNT